MQGKSTNDEKTTMVMTTRDGTRVQNSARRAPKREKSDFTATLIHDSIVMTQQPTQAQQKWSKTASKPPWRGARGGRKANGRRRSIGVEPGTETTYTDSVPSLPVDPTQKCEHQTRIAFKMYLIVHDRELTDYVCPPPRLAQGQESPTVRPCALFHSHFSSYGH